MSEEKDMDMSWNSDKELAILISCIKSPIWIEGQEDFYIKCHIRELLQKCAGGKIVKMLKSVLSTEEKSALVKTELESFFQSQAQSFENYMKIKNDPDFSNDIKIKTEPMSIESDKEMSNKISLANIKRIEAETKAKADTKEKARLEAEAEKLAERDNVILLAPPEFKTLTRNLIGDTQIQSKIQKVLDRNVHESLRHLYGTQERSAQDRPEIQQRTKFEHLTVRTQQSKPPSNKDFQAFRVGQKSLPSKAKVFQTNDRVFAKVKGYPAWPACVSGPNDPKGSHYKVYFYGTYQTFIVKKEDMWGFDESTKAKFGKQKRKGFSEALDEIENRPDVLYLNVDSDVSFDKKPFHCDTCNRNFSSENLLKLHNNYIHKDDK